MSPMPDDQQQQLPPSPEELSSRVVKEKFQDLYTSLSDDYERARSPHHTWEVRLMASRNVCETALELLDETEEPKDLLDQVAERLRAIQVSPISVSATGDFRQTGAVVELTSVNEITDFPPEASWIEACEIRNEQNNREAWYKMNPIMHGLVSLLKKHNVLPWKQDDIGSL